MPPSLPTISTLPQNIMSSISKPKKAKKVAIPKIASSSLGKSMLKGMISSAKSQVEGLSKTAGVKMKVPTLKMAKMPAMQSPKISMSIKRGLNRFK